MDDPYSVNAFVS